MRFKTIPIAVAVAAAFSATAPAQPPPKPPVPGGDLPVARDEGEKKILSVIEAMNRTGATYLSVPIADGRVLRIMAEAVGAKTVVEVGTSTGFSGLWLCLALKKTGGKLITFEIDAGRAATARKYFQQAACDSVITVVEGDAHQKIVTLGKQPLDLVFIDADKEGYVDYLHKLLPLVRSGGLLLAHNVTMPTVAEGYLKAVKANSGLETFIYSEGAGMSVTLKKR
jgi:predicted O-methyltransferase YrrM